ncbi:MAG: hypothetical protein QOF37_2378, partial [Thermoleophilaceae bacterium]|nr:hypothetical protein [Thermoleophilaceae bacterium]
ANEAYLESARQRISVRRHARLVDYQMHDGASARTAVQFQVTADVPLPKGSQLLTRITATLGDQPPPHPTVLVPPAAIARQEPFRESARAAATIFEVETGTTLRPALNELPIYTWDETDCCIPRGATWIDLNKDVVASVVRGSLLLLEETAGVDTGLPADADPSHRQVVRVLDSQALTDPVTGTALTRVTWHPDDALRFPLCVTRTFAGVDQVLALARGNLVLATHGETRVQYHPEFPGWTVWDATATPPPALPRGIDPGLRPYRFHLDEGPLSRITASGGVIPVSALQDVDPTLARPEIGMEGGTRPSALDPWSVALRGLLEGDQFSRAFAIETETDGRALLRFGDDRSGRAPDPGSFFKATYRIGVGRAGNVGAEAIAHYLMSAGETVPPAIAAIRNPLPAWGGIDPESLDRVRERAPEAFRAISLRAVTEDDYARMAERHKGVSHARARFRWTGSWHTVFLTLDPVGREDLDPAFAEDVRRFVEQFTQAGYDLEVRPPLYVPLGIGIHLCAAGEHFRPDVEAAARDALHAMFAPDRVTFGEPLYLSELYAAVEAVDGVDSAVVKRFSRADDDDPLPTRPVTAANVDRGYIEIGTDEILRVDDDPSLPERGWLELTTGGGR